MLTPDCVCVEGETQVTNVLIVLNLCFLQNNSKIQSENEH